MKDCSKVLFNEIESVSPCKAILRIDRENKEYGILEVQNRDFFCRSEQLNRMHESSFEIIYSEYLPCICNYRIMINIIVFFLLFIRCFHELS